MPSSFCNHSDESIHSPVCQIDLYQTFGKFRIRVDFIAYQSDLITYFKYYSEAESTSHICLQCCCCLAESVEILIFISWSNLSNSSLTYLCIYTVAFPKCLSLSEDCRCNGTPPLPTTEIHQPK